MERSGATALFTVNGFLDLDFVAMLRAAAPDAPALQRCVVLRGDAPPGTVDFESFLARADACNERGARGSPLRARHRLRHHVHLGHDGRTQVVMLTHGQSLRALTCSMPVSGCARATATRGATVLPLLRVQGRVDARSDGRRHYIPRGRVRSRSMLAGADRAHQHHRHHGRRTLIAGILDLLRPRPTTCRRWVVRARSAASVPYESVRMYDQLPVEAVGTGYGLTEATAMVSNTGYDDGPDVVAR